MKGTFVQDCAIGTSGDSHSISRIEGQTIIDQQSKTNSSRQTV